MSVALILVVFVVVSHIFDIMFTLDRRYTALSANKFVFVISSTRRAREELWWATALHVYVVYCAGNPLEMPMNFFALQRYALDKATRRMWMNSFLAFLRV